MTVWGDFVAEFVAQNIPGCERGFGPCQAMGFVDDGELVAGFVYHNWSPEYETIEVSGASSKRKWANPDRLSAIFAYPFEEIKCRMVVARHSEHNKRVRRIWRSIGADEYIIPQLRSPTEAEVIATLRRDQWLNSKFQRQMRRCTMSETVAG